MSELPKPFIQPAPEETQAMFARIAPRYDLLNHVCCAGTDLYWRWQLVSAVCKQNPPRVLDLATGSGDVLLALRRAGFTHSVGADYCLPMLQQAQAKGVPDLIAGDGMYLPFADQSFAAVTIAFGLRNVADRAAGLREIFRVLRPGGVLYVLEFSHPWAILATFYFWYLRHVLPRIAGLFTREMSAYEYLGESIRAFPAQPVLAEHLRAAGFKKVTWKNLTLGIVALHRAER